MRLLRLITTDPDECKDIIVLDRTLEDFYLNFYKIPAYYMPISELYSFSEFNRYWKYLFVPTTTSGGRLQDFIPFLDQHYTNVGETRHIVLYQLKNEFEHKPQYYKSRHLVFTTGKKVIDPAFPEGKVILAKPGDSSGVLASSPAYRTCRQGRYTAQFVLRASEWDNGPIVALEVFVNHYIPIARVELNGYDFKNATEYQTFEFDFTLDETFANPAFQITRIHCVVHFNGNAEIGVAAVNIIPPQPE